MPSWELIPEHDRWAIAKYVKSLVNVYDEEEEKWVNLYDLRGEPKAVEIGVAPRSTSERIAHGKAIYLGKGDCIKCHGAEGRGDGPSAADQRDESGYPSLPRDFSEGIFKGGDRPEDLFRRVSFGIGPLPLAIRYSEPQEYYFAVFLALYLASIWYRVRQLPADH
jgi:cytochrome c oxidase cbb3-type subunit 2